MKILYYESVTTVEMKKTFAPFSCNKGSMVVFIAVFIPIMFLLVFMVANVGQMIILKIKLQAAADAAAFAAATVQSIGLNEIADLNIDARLEFKKAENILQSSPRWYSSSHPSRAAVFFRRVLGAIHVYQEDADRTFSVAAKNAAEHVVKVSAGGLNARMETEGLNNLFSSSFEKRNVSYSYYTYSFDWPFPRRTVKAWYHPDDYRYSGHHDGSYTLERRRGGSGSGSVTFNVSRLRHSQTYAMIKLTVDAGKFLFGGTPYRGVTLFSRMPPMRAYAAAMPTGGTIGSLDATPAPDYYAVLVRLKDIPVAVDPRTEH